MSRRLALWVLIALAGLFLLTLLLLSWGLGTASGTRAIWGIASGALEGLEAEAVEGRLAGPFKIQGLRYVDEYQVLEISSLELDWRPGRLLVSEVALDRLQISGVQFTQIKAAPPPEETEPFAVPERIELPFELVVGSIVLEDLGFRSSPEAEPLRVDRAELAATFRGHDLSLDTFRASGPLFSVSASAQALTRDDFPADATVTWELRPTDLAPAKGELLLAGGLEELRLRLAVAPPYPLEQTATLRDIAGDLQFTSEVVMGRLSLSELGAELPDYALEGRLGAEGTVTELGFRASLTVDSSELGPLALSARGGFREQALELQELLLTGSEALRLQAGGRVDLNAQTPVIDLDSDWQSLRWPLQGEPRILAPEGRGTVRGTPQDYAVQLNSVLEVPGQTGGELALSGRGNGESFDLSRLHLSLLEGSIDGTGRVRWSPEVEGRVELAGEGLDPSVLVADMPGDLKLELRASGGMAAGAPAAQIDKLAVTGSFRERPLDLQVRGQLAGSEFALENLALSSGTSRLGARGRIGDTLDLDWHLDSPDLGALLPGATGAVQGEGRVSGRPALPAVRATLSAFGLEYQQYALENLSLDADVDLDRPTPSRLDLSLKGGALGGVTVDTLALTGAGTRADHALHLQGVTSAGEVALGINGDLQEDAWVMQLSEGRLQYAELGAWELMNPHAGRITMTEQALESGCWASSEARLCLQGERGPEALAGTVELDDFDLDYLASLVPQELKLRGEVSARASVEQRGGGVPAVAAEIDAEGVELLAAGQEEGADTLMLALQPSRVTLGHGDEGVALDVTMPFVGEGGISGHVQVGPGSAALDERPLSGRLELDVRDIAFLSALSPEIQRAAGTLHGALELSGSPGAPVPAGELELTGGALQLAGPGLDITGITLRAHTAAPSELVFEGGALSGEGRLSLSGTASLDPEAVRADVDIKGEMFQVVDTADARVFVSPDLVIAVRDASIGVSGDVRVPRAEITPRKLPEAAVSASGDQVIVTAEEDGAQAAAGTAVTADVRLTLGDEVSVDGFGFKGRVSGGLSVQQRPGKPATGTGEFNILDGEYRAYGQGLVIEQGKILFAGGPLNQPGINVRAVRRPAENVLVGVRVRGPVQEPEFQIFSEPGMSQTEQLSWLVLGRPLKGTSEGEGDMLAQAATMLGLKGGNFLADRFGGSLGVDSIGFETGSGEAGAASDVNQAALVIGKYLSPDLYVSYGIGLFDSVSTIRLEYALGEHWKVSTESSTLSSGGDVSYTIER